MAHASEFCKECNHEAISMSSSYVAVIRLMSHYDLNKSHDLEDFPESRLEFADRRLEVEDRDMASIHKKAKKQ